MAVSCQSIFEKLIPQKLIENPDLLEELEGVFEFNIVGKTGGLWTVDCRGHQAKIQKGANEDARVFVEMREEDFIAYFEGRMGGFQAFILGKIRIRGETDLALRMGELLRRVQ